MVTFVYDYIFIDFGLAIDIFSDQDKHFVSKVKEFLLTQSMVLLRKFSSYHPQDNNQAKSTNKTLYTILTKVVENSRGNSPQETDPSQQAQRRIKEQVWRRAPTLDTPEVDLPKEQPRFTQQVEVPRAIEVPSAVKRPRAIEISLPARAATPPLDSIQS